MDVSARLHVVPAEPVLDRDEQSVSITVIFLKPNVSVSMNSLNVNAIATLHVVKLDTVLFMGWGL